MATTTKRKPGKNATTRSKSVKRRIPADPRPMPGYPLPVQRALKTYLMGGNHTRIHVHAVNKVQAIAMYKKRIAEMIETYKERTGFPSVPKYLFPLPTEPRFHAELLR